MNRKITNTMAKDASSLMKEKAYGQKVENARAKVNAAVEELIRKYIPAPVIACVNEYSTYFACAQYASITTVVSIDGFNKTLRAIDGTLTFKIPTVANYVKVANW